MKTIHLTVSKRLGLSFGVMGVVALLLGILAVFGIHTISIHTATISEKQISVLQALDQINRERMVIYAQTQSAFAQETHTDAGIALRSIQEERQKSWQAVDQWWEILRQIPHTSVQDQVLQQQLQEQYQAWRAIHAKLDSLIARLASGADPDPKFMLYAEYRTVVNTVVPISKRMGQIFDTMAENNTTRTKQIIQENRLLATKLQTLAIVATVLSVMLAVLLGRTLTHSVIHTMGGEPAVMVAITQQIAQGDLTVPFTNTGRETGVYAAMRDMVAQLQTIVGQVSQASQHVSTAAIEITQGHLDFSQHTAAQTLVLGDITASLKELTHTVKQSADQARYANQLAGATRSQAEQGEHIIDQAMTAMNAINQSSRHIANVVNVIDDIAFQTNVLALNAAVEATRVGEHGRSFAVVAGEVCKLAQHSADATKEIKALITNSIAKIEDGSHWIERSGQTLREIVASVKKTSDVVAKMTAATHEQATGIEQLNQVILQMDQLIQQNAARVEQASAASHAMSGQARALQHLINFFRIDGHAVTTDKVVVTVAPCLTTAPRLYPAILVKPNASKTRPSAQLLLIKQPAAWRVLGEKTPVPLSANAEEWEEF